MRRVVAVVGVALMVAAGCGGEGSDVAGERTPAPTAAPSPEPSPPDPTAAPTATAVPDPTAVPTAAVPEPTAEPTATEATATPTAGPVRPDEVEEVEVDGRSHAYFSAGQGEPTVVFETGLGDGMEGWVAMAEAAARFSRVFAYDRAGYGRSDPGEEPRDGLRIVDELRTILDASGHRPPYLLVGHSLGGMYVELFARTHPDEVVGLVLVDATPAQYLERCVAATEASRCGPSNEWVDQLPEPLRSELQSRAATEEQVLSASPAPQIPTVVIVSPRSDGQPDTDAVWVEVQRERAAALDATLVMAEESGHYVQFDEPELVLEAIRKIVEQHRS